MCQHHYKHSEPCGCEVEVTVRSGKRHDWIVFLVIGLIIAAIIAKGDPVSHPAAAVQYAPKAEPVEWGRWIATVVGVFMGISLVFIGMILMADYLFARGGWGKIFRKKSKKVSHAAITATNTKKSPQVAVIEKDRRLQRLIDKGKVCYDYVDLNALRQKK